MTIKSKIVLRSRVVGDCWLWSGWGTRDGYGRIDVDGRKLGAHRVAYEAWVGPIPDGLTIDHLCRNRACVNPWHLEPVTQGENIRRGHGTMRYRKYREYPNADQRTKTHCVRGHRYTAETVRMRRDGYGVCRICCAADQRAWLARRKEIAT